MLPYPCGSPTHAAAEDAASELPSLRAITCKLWLAADADFNSVSPAEPIMTWVVLPTCGGRGFQAAGAQGAHPQVSAGGGCRIYC